MLVPLVPLVPLALVLVVRRPTREPPPHTRMHIVVGGRGVSEGQEGAEGASMAEGRRRSRRGISVRLNVRALRSR